MAGLHFHFRTPEFIQISGIPILLIDFCAISYVICYVFMCLSDLVFEFALTEMGYSLAKSAQVADARLSL